MSLVVDKIKVVEESDEAFGDDDIYLIVFQGRTVPPFNSGLNSVGPGVSWANLETGDTANSDKRVASTNSDGVYAVMMVEEDASKDVTGSEVLGAWKAQTALTWKSIMLSMVAAGTPTGSTAAKDAGFAGIKSTLKGLASIYMEFPKGDDDVLDVERVTITQVGQTQTIDFISPPSKEDAQYKVTFKQTSAP